MRILFVVLVGIALSMDAFGVCISIGLNSMVKRKSKFAYILSFASFQFLFTFIGGASGYYFDTYVIKIPEVFGGAIIGAVGLLMLIDGTKEKESTVLTRGGMILILGISTSIDALVVGFTALHHVGSILILLLDSILVGLIGVFLCTFAFFACRYLRKIKLVYEYADFIGGITLIIFAIKMMFF